MSYRKATKCSDCGDVMWFRIEDTGPQHVVCPCGSTELTEDGPVGNWTEPSAAELEAIQ